jgi:hypothetical protein
MNDLLSVVQCFQTTHAAGEVLPRSGFVQVGIHSGRFGLVVSDVERVSRD